MSSTENPTRRAFLSFAGLGAASMLASCASSAGPRTPGSTMADIRNGVGQMFSAPVGAAELNAHGGRAYCAGQNAAMCALVSNRGVG